MADHPELQFVQAKSYAKGRTGEPLWIVVHDMEAGESSTRAESTAEYFRTLPDGRSVSSHYCCDDDSVIQCVLLKDTAHTTGGNPGNPRGINWELSGFARQTRDQWLDPFGLNMFAQMAPIVRADATRFGIPLERRTVAELRAFKPGITSHDDIRKAFGGTTHTDPGPAFPWDVFLDIMRGGDDMPTAQEVAAALLNTSLGKTGPTVGVALQDGYVRVTALQAEVTALRAAVEGIVGGDPDSAAILAGVDERLAAFRAQVEADTRDAVADLAEGGAPAVRADAE